jgi:hypothetical protein
MAAATGRPMPAAVGRPSLAATKLEPPASGVFEEP